MSNLGKSATYLFVIMVMAKFLGALKITLLANEFGASYITDAYSVACLLPTVVFTIIISGVSASYMPMYFRISAQEERDYFFSNTACIMTVISLIGSFLCYVSSDLIVSILAPGFNEKTAELTSLFVQITTMYFPFYMLFNIFVAQSYVGEDFRFPNICNSVVTNLIIAISILIAGKTNEIVLPYGYVISMMAVTILLWMRLALKGIHVRWEFSPKDQNFKALLFMALPAGISFLANQINGVVDKMFSSILEEGIISALNYAEQLQSIPISLVVSILLIVCRPRINKYLAEGKNEEGIYYAKKSLLISLYISIPLMLFFMAFSEPIIAFLLGRGAFHRESIAITSNCLLYYSIGIPFFVLRQIACDVLIAKLQQRTVLINSLIIIAINAILDFFFMKYMGYSGIALATSISGVVSVALLVNKLRDSGICLAGKEEYVDFFKISFCSLSAFGGYYVVAWISPAITSHVAIACIIFMGVYCLLSRIARIQIVPWLYVRVKGLREKG